mgnify:CR=1 FL=1
MSEQEVIELINKHIGELVVDKTTIQKAIVWSETSLKIAKNVHYYLDTLAQLYYKNGEKTKAISTEEKALELGKDSEYGEEYKITLEKMKNGSYWLDFKKASILSFPFL